jgi:K+-sensing histidine kinase KdpD
MTLRATSKPNILIVDDTVENLRVLSAMLSEQGYQVRPVTSGRLALQAVERDPPDLILLDINMPHMSGFEVCIELQARPELKDIPVVFLTALSDVADKVKAFGVGGRDYITKPFQLEEVHARVKTHVALRRAGLELSHSFERLASLEKLRDDLVHMVVHDMRSPLAVLAGHLELLRASAIARLNEEEIQDLSAAERATGVLRRMANELLDVSRLEEGKLPLRREAHDLVALVVTVVNGVGALARKRAIELDLPATAAIPCDASLIQRVLENLLSNALKHTSNAENLHVSVAADAQRVRVEVADSGPGVPVEARQSIFEKFTTLERTAQTTQHSAGLGLAFCKLAVEAHGGAIGVEPRSPRGSIFWFELPFQNPQ